MDKILSFNTIKNVFAALGAKTSDDNYGVALLDKNTAEPKGLMGMSYLAQVLGSIKPLDKQLDLNDITETSIFRTDTDTANVPSGAIGLVVCIKGWGSYVLQIMFASAVNNTYYRVRWDEGWREWREIG